MNKKGCCAYWTQVGEAFLPNIRLRLSFAPISQLHDKIKQSRLLNTCSAVVVEIRAG
jgi:hypothetical protein